MEINSINQFSFKRLYTFTKDLLFVNRRFFLLASLIYFGILVIPYILRVLAQLAFSSFSFSLASPSAYSAISNVAVQWFYIFIITIFVMGSHFSHYKREGFFQTTFLLPLKMSEKFFALIIVYTLIIPLFLFCTNLLAIFVQYLVSYSQNIHLFKDVLFSNWDIYNNGDILVKVSSMYKAFVLVPIMLLAYYFPYNVYMCGAMYFKRNSVIMTTLVMFVLTILFGGLTTYIVVHFPKMQISINEYNFTEYLPYLYNILMPIVEIFLILINAFLIWLSWYKFKKIR